MEPIDPFPDVKAYADTTTVVVTIYGEKGVTQVLVVTISIDRKAVHDWWPDFYVTKVGVSQLASLSVT